MFKHPFRQAKGRKGIGMEISRKYCELAVKRLKEDICQQKGDMLFQS